MLGGTLQRFALVMNDKQNRGMRETLFRAANAHRPVPEPRRNVLMLRINVDWHALVGKPFIDRLRELANRPEGCALGALLVESHAMGLLTFGLNVTLDGCIDHTQGIVDDELHDYWTQLMDQSGAMLFGRNTYELMEGAWPAVARDEKAPRAMREWAQKLEAKPKYVVSGSRNDFPWQNTIKVEGDLREAISALKAKTERGVLVGAPKLAVALEELGLIDEYRIVVHPVISGRGPTLFHGLSSARHLELLSTQRIKSGVQALHFRRKAG